MYMMLVPISGNWCWLLAVSSAGSVSQSTKTYVVHVSWASLSMTAGFLERQFPRASIPGGGTGRKVWFSQEMDSEIPELLFYFVIQSSHWAYPNSRGKRIDPNHWWSLASSYGCRTREMGVIALSTLGNAVSHSEMSTLSPVFPESSTMPGTK